MPYGPFGNMFPYSDQHSLNLDWIIQVAKDFLDQYTHIQEIISSGEDSLDEHTQQGLTALQAWYDEHSADIANALTAAIGSFQEEALAYGNEVIDSIPETYTAWTVATDNIIKALGEDVEKITGNAPIAFKYGYFKFSNQGANVELTPTEYEGRVCAKYACSAGDVFTLNVTGGGGTVLAYGFADALGNVITRSGTSAALTAQEVTAPEGAAFLVVNNLTASQTNYWAIKGVPFLQSIAPNVDKVGLIVASGFSYYLRNLTANSRSNITVDQGWLDLPVAKSGMFYHHNFNSTYALQLYFTHTEGIMYNRIVNISTHAVYRDWVTHDIPDPDPVTQLNVLAIGDSICKGGRNSNKGFIGDIGCPYVNMGIGGATISNKTDSSEVTDTVHFVGAENIPDELVKYATECTEEDWYLVPDVIIAEGGVNDMPRADLGTIPTQPVHTDEEAALIDQSTVTGGLQYMFYMMIKYYPMAHRFFLITNRLNTRPWTPNTGETTGYTQTQLADAIRAVCKLYSVKVIDIFNDSPVDSYFAEYNSPTEYSEDHSVTDLYCIDKDKVHPLALGYKVGYVPFVREALRTAIVPS